VTGKLRLIVAMLAAWLAFGPGWTGSSSAAEESVPTNITADSLHYDLNARTLVFEGSVKVDREDLRMESNSLFARFSKGESAGSGNPEQEFDPGSIERIEARGQVVIHYQGRTGYCGLATYDVIAGLLTLEDQPEIRDGENRIQGQIIRFHLRENRSEVVGGGDRRVKAPFSTPKGMQAPAQP